MKFILTGASLLLTATLGLWAGNTDIPKQTKGPDIIDGELTDSCWKKAARTPEFHEISGKKVTEKAHAKYFADDKNLYVGFVCQFNDYQQKSREITRESGAYSIDVAEIFIDPGSTGNYIHIGVNAAGSIQTDGIIGALKYGVQMHQNDWTMEIQIPFAALKLPDSAFLREWKINFARGNNSKKEFLSWANVRGGSFHDLEGFIKVGGINIDLEKMYRRQQQENRGNFVISFPRRLYDIQKMLPVTVDLKYEQSMKGFSLNAKVLDQTQKILWKARISPVFFQTKFEIPLKEFDNGRYSLDITLSDRNGKSILTGKCSFWKIPPMKKAPQTVYTIKDHSMQRNDKFFFPIGIWSWSARYKSEYNYDRKKYLNAQDQISKDIQEHGFNCVINSPQDFGEEDPANLKQYGGIQDYNLAGAAALKKMGITFAEKAARLANFDLGLIAYMPYLISDLPREAHIAHWVNMMLANRDCSNIMLYLISDEADGAVELNKLRTQLHKEMDPHRLTWLNVINAVAQNKESADIISTDPYPIPNGKIDLISIHTKRLLNTLDRKRSPWLFLQIWGEEKGTYSRPPTPEEERAMVYLAMNHGVRGIFYFTYQPPENRNGIYMNPNTWNSLKVLHPQIKSLAEMYCNGSRKLQKVIDRIDIAVIEFNNTIYVSAVNLEKESERKVKFDLSGLVSGRGDALFENRSINSVDGTVEDTFKPYEVHVYKFPKQEKTK